MAHTALHVSLGMAVATAVSVAPIVRAWKRSAPLAPAIRTWLVLSYGLGLYAIVPSLLRRAGCPDTFCGGWWMNVFLLHPWLTGLKAGGTIAGPAALGACFAAQYLALLAAIRRAGRCQRG